MLLVVLGIILFLIPFFPGGREAHSFADVRYYLGANESALVYWLELALVILLSSRVSIVPRRAVLEVIPGAKSVYRLLLITASGYILFLMLVGWVILLIVLKWNPILSLQILFWRWLPDMLMILIAVVLSVRFFPSWLAPIFSALLWIGGLAGQILLWDNASSLTMLHLLFPPYRYYFTVSWNPLNILWMWLFIFLLSWMILVTGLLVLPLYFSGKPRLIFPIFSGAVLLFVGASGLIYTRQQRWEFIGGSIFLRESAVSERTAGEAVNFERLKFSVEPFSSGRNSLIQMRALPGKTPLPSVHVSIPTVAKNLHFQNCQKFSEYHLLCKQDFGQEVHISYEILSRTIFSFHRRFCNPFSLLYSLESNYVPRVYLDEIFPHFQMGRKLFQSQIDTYIVEYSGSVPERCRTYSRQKWVKNGNKWICSGSQLRRDDYKVACFPFYFDCFTVPVVDTPLLKMYLLPQHIPFFHREKWNTLITTWQNLFHREGIKSPAYTFVEIPFEPSAIYIDVYFYSSQNFSLYNAMPLRELAKKWIETRRGNLDFAQLYTKLNVTQDELVNIYLTEVEKNAGN